MLMRNSIFVAVFVIIPFFSVSRRFGPKRRKSVSRRERDLTPRRLYLSNVVWLEPRDADYFRAYPIIYVYIYTYLSIFCLFVVHSVEDLFHCQSSAYDCSIWPSALNSREDVSSIQRATFSVRSATPTADKSTNRKQRLSATCDMFNVQRFFFFS